MKKILIKIVASILVVLITIHIGVNYVAPRVLLKLPRHSNHGTAADYGMRFDELLTVSEDTLDLKGEMIFPFQSNVGDTIVNHSLIVLHPIKTNITQVYPFVKSFITLGVNFICFDSRAHGNSEGHLYTLGIKEAEDVSKIIDMITNIYPDHSFGIYGKGNASNIALRAMSQDERIRYGIVENFHNSAAQQLEYMNVDDIFFSSDLINNRIYTQAIDFLEIDKEEIEIDLKKIKQPLLILSTPYNLNEMTHLYNGICSETKILSLYNENITLKLYPPSEDEGLKDCIEEFILLQSEEATEYVKEQVFQPS